MLDCGFSGALDLLLSLLDAEDRHVQNLKELDDKPAMNAGVFADEGHYSVARSIFHLSAEPPGDIDRF